MKKTAGWYTWLHHDVPIEWTNDLDERLGYIRGWKSVAEVPIRLRAIVLVPKERVPRAYDEAGRAYDEAKRAYDEALRAYDEALRAYDEAGRAYYEAKRAYYEAWRAYDEAGRAYDEAGRAYDEAGRAYKSELIALAAEFAPDAPVQDGALAFR